MGFFDILYQCHVEQRTGIMPSLLQELLDEWQDCARIERQQHLRYVVDQGYEQEVALRLREKEGDESRKNKGHIYGDDQCPLRMDGAQAAV